MTDEQKPAPEPQGAAHSPEDKEFYYLMQTYRHWPLVDQEGTIDAYNAVLDYVRKSTAALQRELAAANKAVKELTTEFHAAINEPSYAGTRQDWINRCMSAEAELETVKSRLVQARLEIEWRDDVLADWCETVNDLSVLERKKELQDTAFDKTNDFWSKSKQGLELTPFSEKFLLQSDSYDYMDKQVHDLLDKLGVTKVGGSYVRIEELHKQLETVKAALEKLKPPEPQKDVSE